MNMGSFIRANRWPLAITLGVLVPNFALAVKAKITPVAQQNCESQASVSYKTKAVEVAMASLVGDLSELEAASAREGIQRRIEAEKKSCLNAARASASTGSL